MTGRLEMFVGSMFAEKTSQLIRQGKRHLLAGRKVVFIKPSIDGRYGDDVVSTHDGVEMKAYSVHYNNHFISLTGWYLEANKADVVCIDEVQFFPKKMVEIIETLLQRGIRIYVSGLDMDRFGRPFGIVPHLMAIAEDVTKVRAVCGFCGEDAWRTLGTEKLNNNNQINVGNDYIPACRRCVTAEEERAGIIQ